MRHFQISGIKERTLTNFTMEIAYKPKIKLKIDESYSDSELRILKMKPLDNHGMNYEIYQRDSTIYYFDRIDPNTLRLYCSTSKQSYVS